MQPPTFRKANPNDAITIRALVRAAYAKWVPVIGREPMPMRADYDRAIADHHIELLTLKEDLVGVIEMMILPDHLWIENIAVHPNAQGKGFGKQLLARAQELAHAHNVTEIRLLTNGAFTDNIQLYENQGYKITAREPFMGGITVYMSKALFGGMV
ncbi:MAG: GNAT family N-acetyltransferase [Alphaproteobacteria bacterium]|nr:GNAT family N-acetyltransferase [Alphaproteobacteria bacterium]